MEPKPSRWAPVTLVISATFGFTKPLVQAISPGALAPSSITAWRVFGGQAQQGERHADVVVEVAVGGQGALAQQHGDHLFHGGLAGVAGDRHTRSTGNWAA